MAAPELYQRAYSLLHVKSVDVERRVITGTATTPEPDRMGDVIEPLGVQFKNPLPLLLFHDTTNPVGTVKLSKPTKDGVEFEAKLPEVDQPGKLRDEIERAWQLIKAKLVQGVSIGFRPLNDAIDYMKDTGGFRFRETEVLELSLVTVPANASATIHTIKSLDRPAASGVSDPVQPAAGATASPRVVVVKATPQKPSIMKPVAEQITAFEATRQAKAARMTELMNAVAEKGETLDAEQSQEYDGLEAEVKAIDTHLTRLRTLEAVTVQQAAPVTGVRSVASGSAARGSEPPVITVRDRLEPGIGFARAVKCEVMAHRMHRDVVEIAKQMYPGDNRLHNHFIQKTNVAGGTTTDSTWAGPLVDPTNLASEFVEFLRPQTIIGKFGQGGIPSLRQIPFNVRIIGQTTGGTGYWVGQGAAKPLTKYDFEAVTHNWAKVAAIAVITEELARFSTPSADTLTRQSLTDTLVARLDTDFIDPDKSIVANVSPRSITNGIAPLATAGSSAADVRVDVMTLMGAFISANNPLTTGVWIMTNSTALALSLIKTDLGQPEYPGLTVNGGTFQGLPVIASQYARSGSPAANLVALVNASDIYLSDDGQVTVDASREASLEMDDAPSSTSAAPTESTMVSMWQTNSIALRAERMINWSRRRSSAVAWIESVTWGSTGGSPA